MPFVKFEGVSFNKEWAVSKTFEEFYAHEKHHGLSREKMKEIHDLLKASDQPQANTAKEAVSTKQ